MNITQEIMELVETNPDLLYGSIAAVIIAGVLVGLYLLRRRKIKKLQLQKRISDSIETGSVEAPLIPEEKWGTERSSDEGSEEKLPADLQEIRDAVEKTTEGVKEIHIKPTEKIPDEREKLKKFTSLEKAYLTGLINKEINEFDTAKKDLEKLKEKI